jgi:hypothetical protein
VHSNKTTKIANTTFESMPTLSFICTNAYKSMGYPRWS